MDRSAIDELQMHGQDIPWLLAHWAEHKPDHPALVWDPPTGEGRTVDLRRAARRHRSGWPSGCRDHGVGGGDKVLIHAENCPEMLLAWLACATLGAVAVTTNTRSAAAEIDYFVDTGRSASPPSPSPQYAGHVAEARRRLRWIAVIGDDAPAPTASRPRSPFADLTATPPAWARSPDRADAPVRHHVHVGHDQPAQGGGAHPRQRGVGQPHRSAQHRPRHRRPLPDLPPALPRERAELVVLLGARRRRHRGAHAQVVDEPLLGRRDRATRSPTSR